MIEDEALLLLLLLRLVPDTLWSEAGEIVSVAGRSTPAWQDSRPGLYVLSILLGWDDADGGGSGGCAPAAEGVA